MAAVCGVSS